MLACVAVVPTLLATLSPEGAVQHEVNHFTSREIPASERAPLTLESVSLSGSIVTMQVTSEGRESDLYSSNGRTEVADSTLRFFCGDDPLAEAMRTAGYSAQIDVTSLEAQALFESYSYDSSACSAAE